LWFARASIALRGFDVPIPRGGSASSKPSCGENVEFDLVRNGIETQFIDANGMRFETLTAGDPNSPKLALLLHGFPEHAYSWRYQMPLLAKLGYRVWAPNQRGYGNTTRPARQAEYHLDRLLEDVAALIDASKAESVTLIGHDWGGIVGWMFALRGIRPLERFVVMNLPHPQRFHEGLQTKAQRKRSRYAVFFQLPWLPEFLFRLGRAKAIGDAFLGMAVDKSRFPSEVLDVYRDAAAKPGALKAMINWYRANAFTGMFKEKHPVLETPTLMVWGEMDTALGKELTYGTDELVRDFTLRYLPNASHWVQQDAPDAVNEILEAWLTDAGVPEFSDIPSPESDTGAGKENANENTKEEVQ
jgi:pimeloyl-ACP methyl ester carboxylesterase